MPPRPEHVSRDRSLLRDEVFHRLQDAIVDGTLAPGAQLRDAELTAWLGVSRTPVREALLRLADVGLVVARPGRSTTVSELDPAAFREARDLVAGLLATAVRQAVPRLTAPDLAAMWSAHGRFAAAVRSQDAPGTVAAADELFGVVVRVAGNRMLAAVLERYLPVPRRVWLADYRPDRAQHTADLQATLVRHCEAGEAFSASVVTFDMWGGLAEEDPGARR